MSGPSFCRQARHSLASLAAAVLLLMPNVASAEMGDTPIYGLFMVDQLEARFDGAAVPVNWQLTSWVGSDWDRL
jgi:uncharacterized protein involved in copper resistance